MHITIGYLISKPEDFKNCKKCNSFNWYEREACIFCGSKDFRKTLKKDVEAHVKFREGIDEHFCDECEIDV